MEEFFKSFREDIERTRALWIINNIDLIEGYYCDHSDHLDYKCGYIIEY